MQKAQNTIDYNYQQPLNENDHYHESPMTQIKILPWPSNTLTQPFTIESDHSTTTNTSSDSTFYHWSEHSTVTVTLTQPLS